MVEYKKNKEEFNTMDKKIDSLEKEQEKLEQDKKDFEERMQEFKEERKKFDEDRERQLTAMETERKKMQERIEPDKQTSKVNINIAKPVIGRLRQRVRELQKLTQAKNEKIMRGNIPHWITTPPSMHVSRIIASINNGVAKISYYVYKSNEEGNKLLQEHKAMIKQDDGTEKEIVHSANYVFEKLVVETIEYLKPMKTEVFKENDIN